MYLPIYSRSISVKMYRFCSLMGFPSQCSKFRLFGKPADGLCGKASLGNLTKWNFMPSIYFLTFVHKNYYSLESQDAPQQKMELRQQKKEAKRKARLERQLLQQKQSTQKEEIVYRYNTPQGEKKVTSCALPEAYSPKYVEAAWYDWWESQGYFCPKSKENAARFVMVLPPPNVTGTLHLGHALGSSIQDAISRWHRMHGHCVLWNPGCDHAGIATQAVVEKYLWREHNLTRHELGREAFINEVWKWKEQKGDQIYKQMRRLGSSLDWSRACFTLDPKLSHAVSEAFIQLHDQGLIYRDTRFVNWSCALKSAISDIEVENYALEGKSELEVPGYDRKITLGVLTSFAYPIENSDQEIVVATTRPETMLGDTGIAVHPDDPKYSAFHGRYALHPFTGQKLPIVCDTFVDREFGTGAVKLTPAHDQNDYEVGCRHQLPMLDIIDDHGNMHNVPEQFLGLGRFAARKAVVEALKQHGLYRGSCSHAMTVPMCSRSGDVIEPRLKEQWFVSCTGMAQDAVKVVESGELQLIPAHHEQQWYEWLNTIRDWCVSRQLWWGHRIPAYMMHTLDGKAIEVDGRNLWICAHSESEAQQKASHLLQVSPQELLASQDEDVLDTWFSSAIFPFSIFGWPQQTADLDQFYPTDLLETASDIMFFWVARMVMLGHQLTGQLPFKQVLFHSILRDSHGRKMSKSLGNVIDPMDVIHGISLQDLQEQLEKSNLDAKEVKKAQAGQKHDFPLGIPECGADALRFTLCSYNIKAHFANVDVSHIKKNRHFCNKVWQACRFTLSALGENFTPQLNFQTTGLESGVDNWILSRLSSLVTTCNQGFADYTLNAVTAALYNFWWAELCDVYLESIKPVLQTGRQEHQLVARQTLLHCVDTALRALAPFMPYLTEELYQRLPCGATDKAESICIAQYPRPEDYPWKNVEVEADMNNVKEIVTQALSLRRDFNLTKQRANVYLEPVGVDLTKLVEKYMLPLKVLSRSDHITLLVRDGSPGGCIAVDVEHVCRLHMELEDLVDAESDLNKARAEELHWRQELDKLKRRTEQPTSDSQNSLLLAEKVKDIEARLKRLERVVNYLQGIR